MLRRVLVVAGLLVVAGSASALAVSPEDLANLHRAGLGDEVLAALIETTGVQGTVDAAEALDLSRAGVSDRIIAQAIRRAASATVAPVAAEPDLPPALPGPTVTVIGGTAETAVTAPGPGVVIVPVPWVIAGPAVRCRGCRKPTVGDYRGFGRFINTDLRPLNTDLRPLNDGFVQPPGPNEPSRPTSPRR